MKSRRPKPLSAGRKGDDRFRLHDEIELARHAVRHEHGVFRGLLACLEWLGPKFEAPKPFDVGVAFVARQQQTERIALLGPQPLAVLRIGEQRVVERLFDRDAARHRGCVGAFGQHPFRLGLDAGFRENGRQGNSGPFAATEQAVRVLRRQFGFRRAPVLGVAGTFEEVDPRHGWKSRQIVHGEDERPLDQSMHHQPVLRRIDRRNPGMVALIMQAVRGDDSVQVLERRQAERRQPRRAARASRDDNGARHWLRTWTAAHKAGSASPRRVGAAIPGPRAAGCPLPAPARAGNDRRSRRACARSEQAPTGEAAFVAVSWLGRGRGSARFGRPRAHLCTPCRSGPRLADDACNRRADRLARQERDAHSSSLSGAIGSRAP